MEVSKLLLDKTWMGKHLKLQNETGENRSLLNTFKTFTHLHFQARNISENEILRLSIQTVEHLFFWSPSTSDLCWSRDLWISKDSKPRMWDGFISTYMQGFSKKFHTLFVGCKKMLDFLFNICSRTRPASFFVAWVKKRYQNTTCSRPNPLKRLRRLRCTFFDEKPAISPAQWLYWEEKR